MKTFVSLDYLLEIARSQFELLKTSFPDVFTEEHQEKILAYGMKMFGQGIAHTAEIYRHAFITSITRAPFTSQN